MNIKEVEAVTNLPASKRYEYFIKKVADFQKVWGLFQNGWATSEVDNGKIAVPFWPKEEFALECAKGEWAGYHPESINLEDFLNKWLIGMKTDGYKISVFPTNTKAVIVEIDILLNDLTCELEKY